MAFLVIATALVMSLLATATVVIVAVGVSAFVQQLHEAEAENLANGLPDEEPPCGGKDVR
jgi:hypothetical protein